MSEPLDPAAIMAEHGVLHWCCGLLPDTPELWSVGKPPCLPYRLAAALKERDAAIDQGVKALGDAFDALRMARREVERAHVALAERDVELTRLRAAEQRVRALADQWRFWPTMSTTVDELLAALDGGQP